LSYTRLWPINYHASQAASTAMRWFGCRNAPRFPGRPCPLNRRRFTAYTTTSINNERR